MIELTKCNRCSGVQELTCGNCEITKKWLPANKAVSLEIHKGIQASEFDLRKRVIELEHKAVLIEDVERIYRSEWDSGNPLSPNEFIQKLKSLKGK